LKGDSSLMMDTFLKGEPARTEEGRLTGELLLESIRKGNAEPFF